MTRKYSNEKLLQDLKYYYASTGLLPSGYKFPRSTYKRYFGSWESALELAEIPLYRDIVKKKRIYCKVCGELTTNLIFCSRSCSASFNNKAFPKRNAAFKKERICTRCKVNKLTYRKSVCGPCKNIRKECVCSVCGRLYILQREKGHTVSKCNSCNANTRRFVLKEK